MHFNNAFPFPSLLGGGRGWRTGGLVGWRAVGGARLFLTLHYIVMKAYLRPYIIVGTGCIVTSKEACKRAMKP